MVCNFGITGSIPTKDGRSDVLKLFLLAETPKLLCVVLQDLALLPLFLKLLS